MILNTIQKRNKLNEVHVLDGGDKKGVAYRYSITDTKVSLNTYGKKEFALIEFQKGPRNDSDSEHGVLDVDLLEICRHRLQCFQAGPYATRENAMALNYIEEALMWLNKRVEDRTERDVLGTNEI